MLNRKFVGIFIFSAISCSTFAGVRVAGLDLNVTGNKGQINILTEGRSNELPDVKVNGRTIEITLNKADPFASISKKVNGAELSAVINNGKATVSAILPYEVLAESVSLGWNKNKIEVSFPRQNSIKQAVTTKTITTKDENIKLNKVSKDSLNEDYLNDLMKENGTKKAAVTKKIEKDEVTLKQASPASLTEPKTDGVDNFSFAGYAAKFTLFLGLVLGLFYGVVQLLKKGVFNRGKLGFLNNGQLIEVLSTTYVGPKRTLMVVRAHKQIFLVGSSESGLTFLSEMTDTSGLMKEGERHVTGTNFDHKLNEAEQADLISRFKIKENILESAPIVADDGFAKLASAKDDIVKFSEELKKKAKKLRPIENRAN